eukprot:7785383-Karenia_brevis.AAC.1
MKRIPYQLGEDVRVAVDDALRNYSPETRQRLAAAAQRVRDWRPRGVVRRHRDTDTAQQSAYLLR